MFISVKSVVGSPEFEGVHILAGRDGLYRNITSISVNDLKKEFMSPDTVETGSLYITSLHQYVGETDGEKINGYIQVLIENNCSGLIVVSEDNLGLLTEDIIKKCDEARFPLLYFSENKKYSDIMKAVNKYITIEMYNASRTYRIQKVLGENLSETEILAVLDSFGSDIQRYICVMAFGGKTTSDISRREFEIKAMSSARDAFIDCNYIKYYILSSKSRELMFQHQNTIKQMIREYFDISAIGVSGIYEKRGFKRALIEAANAYKIARSTENIEFSFPRISSYNIIAATADTGEARDYYDSMIKILDEHTSAEHRVEIMNTLKAFVRNKGDCKLTALDVSQHENTVRYRMNKLRSWLDMDDDNISFYETISLIAKYSQFLE